MRILSLFAICTGAVFTASCSQPAREAGDAPRADKTTLEGRLAGHWTGKAIEKSAGADGQKDFLSEQLGGYTLDLTIDGQFEANWRGLSKEGKWTSEPGKLKLRPEKVLGKTKAESGSDQSLFDQDNSLAISADEKKLVLPAQGKDSEAVEFSKSSQ